MINQVKKIYCNFTNEFNNYEIILSDGKKWAVPLDEANTDYQAIQEWIAEGGEVIDNTPTE